MDQQLKQRLIGATIIVSLVVIFVPMLFEDRQGDQYAAGTGDIPDLPKEVETKSIELPKTAAEAAPSSGEEHVSSGYRIIPLTDEDPEGAGSDSPELGTSSNELRDSVARGSSTDADNDVSASLGDGQTNPAPSDDARAVSTETPAKATASGKPKPTSSSKAKSDRPSLTAKRSEDIVADSLATPEQPAAAPKTKPKAALTKPVEKVSKKPETEKASRSNPNVKLASPSVSSQKPTQTKSTADASKVARSESVAKAPESVSASPATGSEAKLNAPDTADDLAAWVVQTGSFTAEGNARALAEKLRKSNFPAFVEVVSNSGTSIYRVQVGPELSRTRAEQVQKQIENTVGIKGIVIPHP
ncbi:SPOR domain-containing protein [Methylocaldum szegediense]|uniref:DedD protein n=1 Tax=Methylocaldum szegediense TaxID=73780 RepID=A0ABN8WXT8_9GAMM|nr:SPOR domain-containing protein [Methylocaldum szegediense]CAI8747485.1 DedD protein [Methylocaldum szegediense]